MASLVGTLVRAEHFFAAVLPWVPIAILIAAVVVFFLSKTSKDGGDLKKASYILFALGVVFLLGGYALAAATTAILNSNPDFIANSPPKYPASCDGITKQAERDDCYKFWAVDKKDPSMCELMSGLEGKEWCYEGVAESNGDASLCVKITDSQIRDSCYFSAAIPSPGYSFEPREGAASACEKIENNSQTCLAVASLDASRCGELGTYEADFCYWRVGMARKDWGICEKIENEFMRPSCFFLVQIREARSTNDPSACDKLSQISDLISIMDTAHCYFQIADETNNPELCEKVSSEEARDICYVLARP